MDKLFFHAEGAHDVPAGYKRLEAGVMVLRGDLFYSHLSGGWRMASVVRRTVSVHRRHARKIGQAVDKSKAGPRKIQRLDGYRRIPSNWTLKRGDKYFCSLNGKFVETEFAGKKPGDSVLRHNIYWRKKK